jgi:hypothetical protein
MMTPRSGVCLAYLARLRRCQSVFSVVHALLRRRQSILWLFIGVFGYINILRPMCPVDVF